jgi:glycosyltransferase involved in cell wall biosynthesis
MFPDVVAAGGVWAKIKCLSFQTAPRRLHQGNQAAIPAGATLKLIVEGWRGLSHSYAIVNQWQLLALRRRQDVELRVRDLPFFNPAWRAQVGLFPAPADSALQAIGQAQPPFAPDATWRTTYPHDLEAAPTGRTLVYGTAEYRIIPPSSLAPTTHLKRALAQPALTITTPSHWSAEGFRRLGFAEHRIAVIPHGVDPGLFRPRAEQRDAMRARLRLSGFVFMSAGAMTSNKGMDLLLRAFATVAERHRDVRLLLKGVDRLYPSREYLQAILASLPRSQASLVVQRLAYGGEALPMEQMALLYQAADAYVSPYRAEGFNLPVLEAAASGLPVICTRGGATEDFVTAAFALKIDSKPRPVMIEGQTGELLEPSLDHLVALMHQVVEEDGFRTAALAAGPAHVAGHLTWDHAVEKAIAALLAPCTA